MCALLAFGLLFGLPSAVLVQQNPPIAPLTWAQGAPSARVTLVEYGSLTCGHCAAFNNDVKPALKRTYFDTGRVRFVFRPFPTPPNDLSVAMHVLTLCAGPSRYYTLVDNFFQRQAEIFEAAAGETGPRNILFAIAQDVGGLSSDQAENCLRDRAHLAQIRASYDDGFAAGVTSTPALFINGRRLVTDGNQPYTIANVSTALNAALATTTQPPKARPKAKKR